MSSIIQLLSGRPRALANSLESKPSSCTYTKCGCSFLLLYSFWRRLILTASVGSQHRFIETFDLFFQAVTQQAYDRKSHTIPDIESYITLRRDTSGCKPCFALIEYVNNLDIPDEVMQHPIICALGDAANNHISWSNVSAWIPGGSPCSSRHCRISIRTMLSKLAAVHITWSQSS